MTSLTPKYICDMKIGAFTVATGPYLEYWWQQAQDADTRLFSDHALTLVVFTDRPSEASKFARELFRAQVRVVAIPTLSWPMATMARYELISEMNIEDEFDVVLHLDADTRIAQEVGRELEPERWEGGIALVAHPGFFRPAHALLTALRLPRTTVSDLAGLIRGEAGIGQWERRSKSTAFVPRSRRKQYVCGGVWFGRSPEFFTMTRTLAAHTLTDRRRGITARWHDESHLNWFAAHHKFTLLDSSYCYVHGSKSLSGLVPRIIAVDKGDARVRS